MQETDGNDNEIMTLVKQFNYPFIYDSSLKKSLADIQTCRPSLRGLPWSRVPVLLQVRDSRRIPKTEHLSREFNCQRMRPPPGLARIARFRRTGR